MSTADPDGKIAQLVADMHACLAIEINESVRESAAKFEAVLDNLPPTEPCEDCGHRHTPDGCEGSPTASDLWAGVTPAACDCEAGAPPDEAGAGQ